jgi:hypothetical protein
MIRVEATFTVSNKKKTARDARPNITTALNRWRRKSSTALFITTAFYQLSEYKYARMAGRAPEYGKSVLLEELWENGD